MLILLATLTLRVESARGANGRLQMVQPARSIAFASARLRDAALSKRSLLEVSPCASACVAAKTRRPQLSTQSSVSLWNSWAKALRIRRPVPHAKPACTSRRNLSWSRASGKCRSHPPAALSLSWKAQTPSRRTRNTSPSNSASCFTNPMDPLPHMAPSPNVSARRIRRVALLIPKFAS